MRYQTSIIILFCIILFATGCSKTFDECDLNKDNKIDTSEEKICGTEVGDCIAKCLESDDAPQSCLTLCKDYENIILGEEDTKDNTEKTIGTVGCSITINALDGYETVSAKNFWPTSTVGNTAAAPYGGGSLYNWYVQLEKGKIGRWETFENGMKNYPNTNIVWWELCASPDSADMSYEEVVEVYNAIKVIAPDAEIYATPSPEWPDSGDVFCSQNNGPAKTAEFIDKMVEEGLVKRGPTLIPLGADEITPDGCHANLIGEEIWGNDLKDFFDESSIDNNNMANLDECDFNKDGEIDPREEKVCGTELGDCVSNCMGGKNPPKDCISKCGEEFTQVSPESNITIQSKGPHSFGIHPSSLDNYEFAYDLGVNINREGVYFVWTWVDPERDGHFSFENAMLSEHPDRPNSGGPMNYDGERTRLASGKGIEHTVNVCAFQRKSGEREFNNAEEEAQYQEFVEKLVERYDGDPDLGCTEEAPDCYHDGDGEYPKDVVIEALKASPIKYWQACNQVIDACSEDCQNTHVEKYAKFMELTYKGVKAACPDCEVLIAGDSAKELYPAVYEALNGEYVDIIDKHFFGSHNDYMKIGEEMDYLKNSLVEAGFDLSELRFWATEVGTYSGDPIDDKGGEVTEGPAYQSEKQQAQGLVKRFIYLYGEGMEKILWAWGLVENFGCECCIFDYTGLIYDGNIHSQECDDNDPYDLGPGVKKLGYYSFKKMIEKIDGFDTIEVISEFDNVYVYKLMDNEGPIWIAWNENDTKTITLDVGDVSLVVVTEAAPKYEAGKEVVDYNTAFNSYELDVRDGSVDIMLGEIPVYIEVG